MKDPESLVKAFMADYLAWNDKAQAVMEKSGALAALDQADADYKTLLLKYCRPGFKGEPISFSPESSHDPGKEVVVSVATRDDKSVVKTRHTRSTGSAAFTTDYEYDLVFANGRWYLEQVYYVDHEGKYPGL